MTFYQCQTNGNILGLQRDLAFHVIPLAMIDPDFCQRQLGRLTREWYMHPNGQIPAHECGLLVMLTRLYMLGRLGGFIRQKMYGRRINNFGTRIQNCCLILLGGLTVRIRKAKYFFRAAFWA